MDEERNCGVRVYNKKYSAIKKNEILPFAATWMDIGNIVLSEISQRNKNTIFSPI